MKILYAFIFLFFSALSYTQNLDTIIDNRFSADLKKAPLSLKKGDKIEINSDSVVYLMNKLRYEFCKSLANGDCEDHYEALLKNFKESIAERDKLMASMSAINDSTRIQAQRLIAVYEASLLESRRTLDGTQQALTNANSSLKDALENIKNVRQENFMKKFWVGAGCTGMGIIIGLLLTR